MDEVWKDIDTIKEADGTCAYQVSNLGNVRRAKEVVSSVVAKDMGTTGWCGSYIRKLKPRVLKLNKTYNKKGKKRYVFVSIKDTTYAVHRLVAAAFLAADCTPGLVVNHKDGNKHNNCVDNLEWVTPAENEQHSYDKLGKQVWNKGTKGLMPKQWKEERRNKYVERNKSLIKDHKDGLTIGQLAERYDICKRQVQQILKDNKDD